MPLRKGRQNFSLLSFGVIFWTAATSCSGVVRVVAASFVKIRPFNSAFAASGFEGENMRTLCGNAGSAVVDIVGNFELYALSAFHALNLAELQQNNIPIIFNISIVSLQPCEMCCGVICLTLTCPDCLTNTRRELK